MINASHASALQSDASSSKASPLKECRAHFATAFRHRGFERPQSQALDRARPLLEPQSCEVCKMVTALRYLGYYWLIISALILAAYDWLVLRRLPQGIEWFQVLLLAPGLLLVAAGYRRDSRDVDAAGDVHPGAAPSFRFGERGNGFPAVPRRPAQTTTLNMEQAREQLISSIMKNAGALQKAVLLLAQKDVSVADELSRILQASEALRKLSSDEPS